MILFILKKGLLYQYNYLTKKITPLIDFVEKKVEFNSKIVKLPDVICQ
jgi:hypothetical protein